MRQLKTEEKQLKVEVVLPAKASHVLYATCRAVLYATWCMPRGALCCMPMRRAVLYAKCRAVLYADATWQADALIEQLTSLGVNCRQILEDSFGQSVPPDRPRSSLDRRAHTRARSTHCAHAYTHIRARCDSHCAWHCCSPPTKQCPRRARSRPHSLAQRHPCAPRRSLLRRAAAHARVGGFVRARTRV